MLLTSKTVRILWGWLRAFFFPLLYLSSEIKVNSVHQEGVSLMVRLLLPPW